jgi:hypothetical protein
MKGGRYADVGCFRTDRRDHELTAGFPPQDEGKTIRNT